MKMTQLKKLLSLLLCMVLIAATALITIGCSDGSDKSADGDGGNVIEQPETGSTSNQDGEGSQESNGDPETSNPQVGAKVLGEGAKKFDFNVVELDGKTTQFVIHTDKETVGEALLELGLIEGEEGQFGLYVKKVNGISADYDKDKVYWAFYVDGDYGMTGVDMTKIEEGKVYSFRVSK